MGILWPWEVLLGKNPINLRCSVGHMKLLMNDSKMIFVPFFWFYHLKDIIPDLGMHLLLSWCQIVSYNTIFRKAGHYGPPCV